MPRITPAAVQELRETLQEARAYIFDSKGDLTTVEEFDEWWIIKKIDRALESLKAQ